MHRIQALRILAQFRFELQSWNEPNKMNKTVSIEKKKQKSSLEMLAYNSHDETKNAAEFHYTAILLHQCGLNVSN